MKKLVSKLALLSSFALAGISMSSCGGKESPFVDKREERYTVVSGSLNDAGEFTPDGGTRDFKSLYEAANYCFDNCENGSFVKLKNGDGTKLFAKKSSHSTNSPKGNMDQFFYYRDGHILDGYSGYLVGYTEFFKGERVSRIMSSTESLKYTHQPYHLLKHENLSTEAWNLLPIMDGGIRYNPHAFTGIRSVTYRFDLTKARIRPSYSSTQKVVPIITLSQTDSYNWSNQGIYMDTDTGDWHYLYGETQSTIKDLTYGKEVIMKSTWDKEKQEYTPEYDVRMTLDYVCDNESKAWSNDLTIELIKDKVVETKKFNYEILQMNGRGTPRANIMMDLVDKAGKLDDSAFAPDFMCGAYFHDIVVSEASGKVPEGLTDAEYDGDQPMCCEPGKTYDLFVHTEKNAADVEVILDNYGVITNKSTASQDAYDISYEPGVSQESRTKEVLEVERLIAKIDPASDDKNSPNVIKAKAKWDTLKTIEQQLILKFDGYTQLDVALNK